jgi:uncharacterized membrane protein
VDPFSVGGGIFGLSLALVFASLLLPIVITVVILVAVIRSTTATRRDPAEQELRARLARGEIDTTEFEVRLRALKER